MSLAVAVLVPSSQAARGGGTPVVLVTAETIDQLLVADASVRKRLRMPADPENLEASARDAVVVSPRAGAVTLVGVPALRVRKILRGFGSPHIVLLTPQLGRLAYVTDDARGQLDAVDLARKRVVRRVFVGLGAHHMSLSPDGKRLWIVLGERARSISVVDTSQMRRPRLIGHVDPHGLAHDVAFAPDGQHVWVTYDDRSHVRLFDARSRRPGVTYRAGSPPQHVAFSDNAKFAYVTSGNDGELRILRPADGRLLRRVAVPYGSFNLGLSGGLIVTPSLYRGTLTELSGSGRVLFSKHIAPAARDAAITVL
jgi:hypothetical protein